MGLSLSLLLSAWNEILAHKLLCWPNTGPAALVGMGSLGFEIDDGELTLRTIKFQKENLETKNKSEGLDQSPQSDESMLRTYVPLNDLVVQKVNVESVAWEDKDHCPKYKSKPTIILPQPVILFSPRPMNKLDAAATKVQKVYKSYRTRRNLADCAVVVEELWWKALDFAALKRSSVSFFNVTKPETAASRWARARTRAAKVGKGLSRDEKAQKLALQHWLEAIEREAYEVIVESGKLVYKQNGMFLNTDEDSKWIFVLSTTRALYVGQKKKGAFQHSSFLSGGATTAAGRLVAHDGILEAIWPYSGHYLPTEENFKEFISFLEENHVDLTNVKKCAIDDESTSFKVTSTILADTVASDETQSRNEISNKTSNQEDGMVINAANAEVPPAFDLAKRLSCKWTSGVGPRIGCVRDYPTDLQCLALEKVSLSPKVTPGRSMKSLPIPSPRPSPKIRLSPGLAYMGLPSPRVCASTGN
ncbi:hypothetical protein U1Q18_018921 [Sarracenia purpurea var. burkii]